MKTLCLLLLAMLLAVTAVGCGEDSSEEARAQLKEDLAALKTAIAGFDAQDASSSIDDIKAARADVQESWDAVKESAGDLHKAEIEEVQSAWDDLSKAVDDIKGDMTVPEAVASLSDEVAALKAAWEQLDKVAEQ